MLVVFGFVTFIVYKVLSAFLFDTTLSLVFCLIMAIITAAILQGVSIAFGKRTILLISTFHQKLLSGEVKIEDKGELFFPLFTPPFAVAASINAILGWLIAHGFSESFVKNELCSSRSCEGGLLNFIIVLTAPIIGYYVIQAIFLNSRLSENSK